MPVTNGKLKETGSVIRMPRSTRVSIRTDAYYATLIILSQERGNLERVGTDSHLRTERAPLALPLGKDAPAITRHARHVVDYRLSGPTGEQRVVGGCNEGGFGHGTFHSRIGRPC